MQVFGNLNLHPSMFVPGGFDVQVQVFGNLNLHPSMFVPGGFDVQVQVFGIAIRITLSSLSGEFTFHMSCNIQGWTLR